MLDKRCLQPPPNGHACAGHPSDTRFCASCRREAIISQPLLEPSSSGLYCPRGDFFIDPRVPVARAVITHAHADHARPGSGRYLTARPGGAILKHRLGQDIQLQTVDYGETLDCHGIRLSLHPAGHILGSAQVRLEHAGQVWVVSGDYKVGADATCAPFEPLICHTFITEATYGLPVFHWPPQQTVIDEINVWWRRNRDQGRTSLLLAYSLGKAQRVLAGLDPTIGPIFTHGAVEAINAGYRERGVELPDTRPVSEVDPVDGRVGALVLAPPSADTVAWTRRFGDLSRAFASGWMQIRGHRRRRAVDRGFVLSDHCDWPGLNQTIRDTTAASVWVTHGYAVELARWLREQGCDARVLPLPQRVDGAP